MGEVKQVLRSGGTTDRLTCQSLAVAPEEIHTLGACLSSVAAAIAAGFGLEGRGKGVAPSYSSHPSSFSSKNGVI